MACFRSSAHGVALAANERSLQCIRLHEWAIQRLVPRTKHNHWASAHMGRSFQCVSEARGSADSITRREMRFACPFRANGYERKTQIVTPVGALSFYYLDLLSNCLGASTIAFARGRVDWRLRRSRRRIVRRGPFRQRRTWENETTAA